MVQDSWTHERPVLMRKFVVLASLAGYLVAEIVATTWVASLIGWSGVLILAAVTFVIGMWAMRSAGTAAFAALRTASSTPASLSAEVPIAVGDAGLHFLGGLILVLPGVLADVVGAILVFGPTRVLVRGAVAIRVVRWLGNNSPTSRGDVIEGEVIDRSDDPRRAGQSGLDPNV